MIKNLIKALAVIAIVGNVILAAPGNVINLSGSALSCLKKCETKCRFYKDSSIKTDYQLVVISLS